MDPGHLRRSGGALRGDGLDARRPARRERSRPVERHHSALDGERWHRRLPRRPRQPARARPERAGIADHGDGHARSGSSASCRNVSRPSANRGFIANADQLCRQAAGRLAALPPFPFHDFDPLHPDPSLLPLLGAFFTGPGDPRAILGALDAGLRELGQPPADRKAWTAALSARGIQLSVIDQQDQAALGGDVPGFVRTVHASSANFRAVAITASAFGVTRCVF